MQADTTTLTREEWHRRYAARMRERAALTEDEAREQADIAAEAEESTARYAGKGPAAWANPEWAADEELSYWEGDDDGE